MKIERGELLDSERVDEGDDEFEVEKVVGGLIKSRFNLYALPPPVKKDDIFNKEKRENRVKIEATQ